MKNKFYKSQSGITLLSLVVTIIVLLILAGVSIKIVFGENGIVDKSILTAQLYHSSKYEEQIDIIRKDFAISVKTSKQANTLAGFMNYLKEDVNFSGPNVTMRIDNDYIALITEDKYAFKVYLDHTEYVGKNVNI